MILALALTGCGSNGGGSTPTSAPTEALATAKPAASVTGTYSVTFGTQEISGNVRHTGCLTSQSAQEKNTLELKDDGTYVYTKLISTDAAVLSGETPVASDAPQAAVDADSLTWKEIAAGKREALPDDYADADWAGLVQSAKAPAAQGPVVLLYTFTGSYTVDGDSVILNPAETCVWSEDWGAFQNYGFHNISGTEADKVWPKGETDKYFLPLDHFAGKYLITASARRPAAAGIRATGPWAKRRISPQGSWPPRSPTTATPPFWF